MILYCCCDRVIQVEKHNRATTIIDICFRKTNNLLHFERLCVGTAIEVRYLMVLPNGADQTIPNAVDELNAAQEDTIDTQTTPIRVSLSNNRATTAKRRNTDMDSNELQT